MSNTTDLSLTPNETHNVNDTVKDGGASLTDHWPYFSLFGHGYWSIVLSIVIAGSVGNALQLVMMSEAKLNSLSYSVYLKFLAISDTLLLIGVIFQDTEENFNLPTVVHFSDAFCKILNGFRFGTMLLSPWLVVGLSLDRYVCVCFPLSRAVFCTRRKATVVCSTMVVVAVLLNVPVFALLNVGEGGCVGTDEVGYYFAFLRVGISSMLPCIAILVLNVAIVSHIQRSNQFRDTFTRNRTDSAKDSSTRPLMLVSILAFATLLPVSVVESVTKVFDVLDDANNRSNLLSKALWPVFNTIYLLNFGQNFYILIGTGKNYRNIMKMKLKCFLIKGRQSSESYSPATKSTTSSSAVTLSVIAQTNAVSTSPDS